MMIHTRAGGIYEVMGTMTGKLDVECRLIYIMDAFALPVQGTETRENADDLSLIINYWMSCGISIGYPL